MRRNHDPLLLAHGGTVRHWLPASLGADGTVGMSYELILGDCIEVMRTLPANSVQMVCTSPPYFGLRDYGTATWEGGAAACDHKPSDEDVIRAIGRTGMGTISEGMKEAKRAQMTPRDICGKCGARRIDQQIGLEPDPESYVAKLVDVFREVRRVLHPTGVVWLNLGDSYNAGRDGGHPGGKQQWHPEQEKYPTRSGANVPGLKPKDLIGIPWMVAFALRADGWWLRSEIIWCLSGGTWVYARTQKGDMPMMIRDLARLNPATVKLWNGQQWTQLLGLSKSARKGDELELVLRSGERISCTPTHRWPTQRGLVDAADLRVGDVIESCQLPEPEKPLFPEHITDEAFWFAGLYLAEGNRDEKAIHIAGHIREVERLERVKAIAESYGGTVTVRTTGNGMSIHVRGKMLQAILDMLISGEGAKKKGFSPIVWRYSNSFLASMLDGYLSGDGHWDAPNKRWRLGFTRNYNLERDLRTVCARLGLRLTLNLSNVAYNGGTVPTFRGEIRMGRSGHHNEKDMGEIVEIRKARCREVYDLGVEDDPHLFALASGILTHNSKKAPMPESVTDRPTKAHEQVFLLSKSATYFYDAEAIAEAATDCRPRPPKENRWEGESGHDTKAGFLKGTPAYFTRNKRSVWTLGPESYAGAHFATMPTKLVEPCILAGTSAKGCCAACGAPWERDIEKGGGMTAENLGINGNEHYSASISPISGGQGGQARKSKMSGAIHAAWKAEHPDIDRGWQPTCLCGADIVPCTVLDPFNGAATVGVVALKHHRNYIGIDLNADYLDLSEKRINQSQPMLEGLFT